MCACIFSQHHIQHKMISFTTRLVLVCCVLFATVLAAKDGGGPKEKDMMRKSIVYDKKTPHVFYCPTSKPTNMDKLIVKYAISPTVFEGSTLKHTHTNQHLTYSNPVLFLTKFIYRAKPLSKLCEHEGQTLPEDYKSDCYMDLDESPYACKEKYRIMVRGFDIIERAFHS